VINVFQPSLGQDEIDAVAEVISSNWIGRGPKTKLFEEKLAQRFEVSIKNITTVSCCTNGLFEILRLLDLSSTDEVVLPSISFVGAANAAKATGAKVVFADVDKVSLNITRETLEKVVSLNTKAVILIHYGGVPAEMDEIAKVCSARGITLIEDNACSPFSQYKETNTGTLADFGVWSFDSMKILCCGDGGLIYAKDSNHIEALRASLYLGINSQSGMAEVEGKTRWWEFDVPTLGDRHIMNDISSAIGLVQLAKIDQFLQKRKKIHDEYTLRLKDLPLGLPPQIEQHSKSSYYLYWIFSDQRDELAAWLKEDGIYTTFRYYPLHDISIYGSHTECPITEKISDTCLCLPLHQSITTEEQEHIVSSIERFYNV
tara:strand:+ start:1746 stop:2864 length:1119 start_codon:yes stop_codon:yes gene_type:complete